MNVVLIDTMAVRIGQRLLLAAQEAITSGDFEIGAVLLYSAVEASLSIGIGELTVWRATQERDLALTEDEIERKVRGLGSVRKKLEVFQQLAGTTLKDEALRLREMGEIPSKHLLAFVRLETEFQALASERHRFIHQGKEVDPEIIRLQAETVAKFVFLLDSMWHSTFDLSRPPLNPPGKPGK
ncbi:MAG: hypothetical protein ABIF77_19115 [bacterium]